MRRAACLAALCLLPVAATATPAPPAWETHCRSCHGTDGHGQTPMGRRLSVPDLAAPAWKSASTHDAAFVRRVIVDGVPGTKMKSYRDRLSEADVAALVAFVLAP